MAAKTKAPAAKAKPKTKKISAKKLFHNADAMPHKSKASPQAKPGKKKINLALQGGGSHGAYTWGVLDGLLEDGRVDIEGVSGTSAGALNATLLVEGLARGGAEGAREVMRNFWTQLSQVGQFYPVQAGAIEKFLSHPAPGFANAQNMALDWMTHYFSPYQLNPFNYNPLRDLLEKTVDFELIRKQKQVKIFMNATNVRNGKIRVFETHEISLETLMASACLPMVFKAVEIDGEAYWDGGYSGNPAIFPLIYGCSSFDILLIQINPIEIDHIPQTANDILDRLNEVSFNATLMREMRAIAFVTDLIREGKVQDDEYKDIRMHRIASDEVMRGYDAASKMTADASMIEALFVAGRAAAQVWLKDNFAKIGKKSSIDIEKLFL